MWPLEEDLKVLVDSALSAPPLGGCREYKSALWPGRLAKDCLRVEGSAPPGARWELEG